MLRRTGNIALGGQQPLGILLPSMTFLGLHREVGRVGKQPLGTIGACLLSVQSPPLGDLNLEHTEEWTLFLSIRMCLLKYHISRRFPHISLKARRMPALEQPWQNADGDILSVVMPIMLVRNLCLR